MQLTQVNKDDIPKVRGRTGGVSTKLVQEFLASEIDVAQVSELPEGKKLESIRSTVSNYVKRHELPIKVFTAANALYLERSDEAQAKYVADNKAAAEAAAEAASSNGN